MQSAVRYYPNVIGLNEGLNATNGRLNEALAILTH
jgi:hypothetical protein